ncbi:16S rRNA (guanine(966)-N(2))-methyltransferase RsmD [Angustibacter aerolatus]
MTRLIAGTAGGTRLITPAGRDTRPTSDRVREALFSRLESGGWLDGSVVLDLYAGTGALGLEALSRGARSALLVEQAPHVVKALRANVSTAGLPGARVVADSVERALARPAPEPADLVLADPPYPLPDDAVARVLQLLADGGWLADDALVVVERANRSTRPAWPDVLHDDGDKQYGTTRLWFARTRP